MAANKDRKEGDKVAVGKTLHDLRGTFATRLMRRGLKTARLTKYLVGSLAVPREFGGVTLAGKLSSFPRLNECEIKMDQVERMELEKEFQEFRQWMKHAHETYEQHLAERHLGCSDLIRGTLNKQTQMLLELCGAVEELGKIVERRKQM